MAGVHISGMIDRPAVRFRIPALITNHQINWSIIMGTPVSTNRKGIRIGDIIIDAAEMDEYTVESIAADDCLAVHTTASMEVERTFTNDTLAESGKRPTGERVWMETEHL